MLNKDVFKHISYGVYILTTLDRGRPVGCVVNSLMQVSANPPLIAVSIHHDNFTHSCMVESGMFAFSILPENTPSSLIGTFGFQSSRDTNKFTEVAHEIKEGIPVLKNSIGYVVCKIVDKLETTKHTIFLGEVIDCDDFDVTATPMTHAYYHEIIQGKKGENAPTYIEEKNALNAGKKTSWVCKNCNYVYEGEEIPEGFTCPLCGNTEFE